MIRRFLPLAIFLWAISAKAEFADLTVPPPSVESASYIVADFATGEVVAENNADEGLPPASLTKLMTAYLIFGALKEGILKEDQLAVISRRARKAAGSRMFVEENSQVSVGDLLRGVIVQSGNDASIALAETLAGSEENFVQLMNQQAKLLGLKNTQFADSTGLSDGNQTSARDIAEIARRTILDFPQFYKMYAEAEFFYNGISQSNRNGLLQTYSGADGLKTGYTKLAGYCLAASAIRDGQRFISIVMKTKSARVREKESKKLLNHAFTHFQSVRLFDADEKIDDFRIWQGTKDSIAVGIGESQKILVPKSLAKKLRADLVKGETLIAPLEKGKAVAEIHIKADEKILRKIPVVTLEGIPEGGTWKKATDYLKMKLR